MYFLNRMKYFDRSERAKRSRWRLYVYCEECDTAHVRVLDDLILKNIPNLVWALRMASTLYVNFRLLLGVPAKGRELFVNLIEPYN